MDPRERMNDLQVALRTALQGFQAGLWTALPGEVVSYDATKMTVTVQPTIKIPVRDQQGKWNDTTLPVLPDVLVQFSCAGGFVTTLPIAQGDPGLLIFACRCLDAWWQQGGVQPQAELRMHDLSDAVFIPGLFPQNKLPPNVSTTSAQLRLFDGSAYVDLAPTGKITLKPSALGVEIDGNLNVTGEITWPEGTFSGTGLHTAGAITADGDVTAGTVSLKNHLTSGVQPGGGNSGPPVP